MILDAGCGNRAMWKKKNQEGIIYVDVEKKLQRKPTFFADNRSLPFADECFSIIFFDPPFTYNMNAHPFFSFPNEKLLREKYPDISNLGSYYGIERYKTKSALIAYIYRAEKELYRVLKTDGVLWLRWCNFGDITEQTPLLIFENWSLCRTLEINSSKKTTYLTGSKAKSFWFMLMKKPLPFIQKELM